MSALEIYFVGLAAVGSGDAVTRRWPTHVILLVTDGDGSIPLALPGDKARTSAILIPPDCDPDAMSQIAARGW